MQIRRLAFNYDAGRAYAERRDAMSNRVNLSVFILQNFCKYVFVSVQTCTRFANMFQLRFLFAKPSASMFCFQFRLAKTSATLSGNSFIFATTFAHSSASFWRKFATCACKNPQTQLILLTEKDWRIGQCQ